MSARAWERRRRNKYFRDYERYLSRHPDHLIMFHVTGSSAMVNAALWRLMMQGSVAYEEVRRRGNAIYFRAIPRGPS